MNVAFNMDCMEGMKQYPDKYFDLAVVDPPYGGGGVENEYKEVDSASPQIKATRTGGTWAAKYSHQGTDYAPDIRNTRGRFSSYASGGDIRCWDFAPPPEYWDELFRVSKNQIVWGGNYFGLPPTRCFLVWRKLTISENFSMAMAEYAWTSFNGNAKVFECAPQDSKRFHPTQKPKALYDWIFKLYAKPGMKIIDTHLGSGSSRIAAYDAGLDFVGYEIDKTYFDLQEERFAKHTAQQSLFVDAEYQQEGMAI